MCDTFVSLSGHNASGRTLLAKNSDREPNEAQAIERLPARQTAEKWLRCTYIEVPQVEYTAEIILSRPFQMWGAEMGVNEHGVAIGNEAVFTRLPKARKNDGLTGMDLLRLALERSQTAAEAVNCITGLLETYGQDACGGYRNRRFFYDNSFLLADAREAWLLETAGRHWAARPLDHFYSISNGLTIGDDYQRISSGAREEAQKQGYWKPGEPFHFQRAFSDWFYSYMSQCRLRRQQTSGALSAGSGSFSLEDALHLLSSHVEEEKNVRRGSTGDVCMHAGGLVSPNQTNGSMVAEIAGEGRSVVWLSGSSMPCLSVYLPFFFGGTTLSDPHWARPGAHPDQSLWWQAETLHRFICHRYGQRRAEIDKERCALQAGLIGQTRDLQARGASTEELDAWSREALSLYWKLLNQWQKHFGLL